MRLASARFSCCQDSFTQHNNDAIKAATTKDPLLPSGRWDGQREGKSLRCPWITGSSLQPLLRFQGGLSGEGVSGGTGNPAAGRQDHRALQSGAGPRLPALSGSKGPSCGMRGAGDGPAAHSAGSCPGWHLLPPPHPTARSSPAALILPRAGTTLPRGRQRCRQPLPSTTLPTLPASCPFALCQERQGLQCRCQGPREAHAEEPGQSQRSI